jgi:hypothetical protein
MEGTMKTFLCLLMLAAFASLAMADVTVTGKWSGSFKMEDNDSTAVLMLKQSGADITGTVGPNEDEQFPIQKGKIEGDKISIEVDHDGHTIKFELLLAEDRITGDAHMSADGETKNAKLDVKRVK